MSAAVVDRGTEPGVVDLRGVQAATLSRYALAALAASWIWVVAAGRTLDASLDMGPILAPLALFLSAGGVLLLPRLHPRLRTSLLLAGAACCCLVQYIRTADVIWLYYEVLFVLLGVPLGGPRAPFCLAALASLLARLATYLAPLAGTAKLAPVYVLLWATAAVSYASSSALHTVLGWAIDSQATAWRTASEVIKRREQLRRTLDSLHHAHAALERTTIELEAARRDAEEARQIKGRFVANISHELRTPLNVIVGFAEMLCTSPESYGDFAWPPDLREDLLTIWHNARHLLSMVDDVLDLAQIEAAHLPIMPEPTDLNQLIRDALVTIGPLLRNTSLELRVSLAPGLPQLNLDRTRIRQVLLNLINNALRFTASGFVQVGTELQDGAVLTYVRDTGPGIPEDKLQRIFDEFEQVDTSIRRPHQGAGLGLAISRQFIGLHGGRIWAESAEGAGSTFCFTLPLPGKAMASQPRLARRPMPARHRQEGTESRVVVLSSDPLAIRVLERHLVDVQVSAVATEDGALSTVKSEHPDALFVLAESGAQTEALDQADRLCRALAPLDLTIVVSTMPTERGASSILGVPELLIKPVTADDLLTSMRRLCPRPSRVLIVDDDPDTVRLYTRVLRQGWHHLELLTADTAAGAIALLARRPDLILLDLQLPDRTGLDVLEAARTDAATAKTPVMVVTARGPAQKLLPGAKGAIHVVRSCPLSATETVRLLGVVTKALPPRYAPAFTPAESPAPAPGIPGAAPA